MNNPGSESTYDRMLEKGLIHRGKLRCEMCGGPLVKCLDNWHPRGPTDTAKPDDGREFRHITEYANRRA